MTYSNIQKSQLEGAMRLDAEYYQPEYLAISKKLEKLKSQPLSKIATIHTGPAYSSREMSDDFITPLIRIGDVTRKTDITNWIRISEKEFQKFGNKKINPGDILMTMTGDPPDVGKCNIYQLANHIVGFNQRVARISSKINSNFLFAYLSTEFARLQCERNSLGIRQRNVATSDIRNIKVINISENNRIIISETVDNYISELDNSKLFFKNAEDLLLKELGLDDFEVDEKLFSIINLSECQKANRIDAEYFQPKFAELISKIEQKNPVKLGKIVSMAKGFEPGSETYQKTGKCFIRVSSLSKDEINESDQKYLTDDLFQSLKSNYQPLVGDILLTKDASPGIAYTIKEPIEGIISGGILRLKLKTDLEREYLTLCLNSIIGKMQAERDAGGSIIVHWKLDQIKEIVIPILPKPTQEKIADLVRRSNAARQKSKELLSLAKKKVEELFEKEGDNEKTKENRGGV